VANPNPFRPGEFKVHCSSAIAKMFQRFSSSAGLIAIVGVSGCASTKPPAYEDLPSTSQLKPANKGHDAFLYAHSNTDMSKYIAVTVDPVTVYTGKDSQFGAVPEEQRRMIAEYMQRQFSEVLSKKWQIVNAADSGTLRLHLTLTGIEKSTPVVSALSHMLPVGLLINSGLQLSDHNGTFLGSVSYAVDLYDAKTGELVYASISKETPHALDLTSSFGRLDAAKAGVRRGAKHLRDNLTKNHLATLVSTGSERTSADL